MVSCKCYRHAHAGRATHLFHAWAAGHPAASSRGPPLRVAKPSRAEAGGGVSSASGATPFVRRPISAARPTRSPQAELLTEPVCFHKLSCANGLLRRCSQEAKAADCKSVIVGSTPTSASSSTITTYVDFQDGQLGARTPLCIPCRAGWILVSRWKSATKYSSVRRFAIYKTSGKLPFRRFLNWTRFQRAWSCFPRRPAPHGT